MIDPRALEYPSDLFGKRYLLYLIYKTKSLWIYYCCSVVNHATDDLVTVFCSRTLLPIDYCTHNGLHDNMGSGGRRYDRA